MPTPSDILKVLDDFADRFEFPGFNNMNYETADSRLHCFRGGDRWSLLIEQLVDWQAADGPMRIVFAMGDIRGESLSTFSLFETPIEEDEESGDIVVPGEVVVRGRPVPIDVEAVEESSENHEIEPPFALILQLAASHREALFSTPDELAERVAPGLERILTLDDWAHPDVYGGPKPSESEAFQQLAEVLATGDVGRYASTEPPNNRDWKAWLESR